MNRPNDIAPLMSMFQPGCLEQAVADIQVLLVPEQDGNLESVWLLLE